MPLDVLLQAPWIYVIGVVIGVFWLACVWAVMDSVAEIDRHDRRLTRPLGVRLLLVAGGPVTGIVFVIAFMVGNCLEYLNSKWYWARKDLKESFRKFFEPSPS